MSRRPPLLLARNVWRKHGTARRLDIELGGGVCEAQLEGFRQELDRVGRNRTGASGGGEQTSSGTGVLHGYSPSCGVVWTTAAGKHLRSR